MKDTVPTEIQRIAIPKILDGKNLLLISPTGSGKTEAAILPIFQMLLDMGQEGKQGIRVLYITPLRALNRDMLRRMEIVESKLGITVSVRHGDTSASERQRQSKTPPQVLITTPETFQILLVGKHLRKALENVKWVVIDEIHELAEDERGAQLSVALERLEHISKSKFQRIGLSATVGSPDEFANYLVGTGRNVEILKPKMNKPMKITVQSVPTDENTEQATQYRPDNKHLIEMCKSFIDQHKSTLFFVNTRDTAEWLAASFHIYDEKYPVGIHHGSLSKEVRIQMEDDFKTGRLKALICTSSLELGIDVGSADFVLQYNSPRQVTRAVQRIGRSGHKLDRLSEGIILSTNPDELIESAVIARNATVEKYEATSIRKNPLAVLANQIVAIMMAEKESTIEVMHKIISKAYPFRDLKINELQKIVSTLNDLHEIKADAYTIRKGGAAIDYFYNNISMIPDEKNYLVRDVATRKPIGTLDESFVATYADTNMTFIFRGTSWCIVEIKDNEILVQQIKELGALPSWAGEELPVPFEIAQDVGELRRTRDWSTSPMTPNAKEKCSSYLDLQKDKPLADDRTIVIDSSENRRLFIINACFGTKVNETIGRYVAAMLSTKFGESVGLETDAYRIMIETPVSIDPDSIEQILRTTNPATLDSLMRLVLRNTAIFRYQFMQIAKKFGVIRKDADYRAINLNKLIDLYVFSPIYQEALNRTLWEKMDVTRSSQILGRVQNGSIDIVQFRGLTPIGMAGYETKRELLMYGKPDKAILSALKERLLRTDMLLACLSCKNNRKIKVADVDDRIQCWSCGSVLVAAVHTYERSVLDVLKKKSLTDKDKKEIKRLQKSANIVLNGGKRAVMALAGRGIGADTAARVMEKLYTDENEFLKSVLEAEVNYAKTRRFWD